jgi:MFS family permease
MQRLAERSEPAMTTTYRRDGTTWAAFGALFAFGFLNAVLGPALPYLRASEHLSYLIGAFHQVAFAVGGGVAGLLATHERRPLDRTLAISGGLSAAGLGALLVGYGNTAALTIAGALIMSLLSTSALIRVWAVLADVHGSRRAVAMTEGEVSVSLAGILTPLVIGALAATALGWRFAFVLGAGTAVAASLWVRGVRMPPPAAERSEATGGGAGAPDRRPLRGLRVVVFAIVALEFSLSFWLASYLDDDVGLTRGAAAAAVSGLYLANLAGRLAASRLARHAGADRLLAAALALALLGLPVLLTATSASAAAAGIALVGTGIGALFPLTSALYVAASPRSADSALGQVLAIAAIGQLAGPLAAGAIAQAAGLRAGLLVLPAVTVLAAAGLGAAARSGGRVTTRSRTGAG